MQQMISKMLVRRDLQAWSLSNRDSSCNTPRCTEVPRPKHAVSEGLMTLAVEKRPEANLLIWLSQYALQRHRHVVIYFGGVWVGRWLISLNRFQNSQIKRRGI